MRAAFRYPPKGACKHIRTKRRVRKEYQYLYIAVNSPAGSGGKNFFFLFSFLKICFCCGVFFLSGAEKKTSGEDTREEEVDDEGEKKRKVVCKRPRKEEKTCSSSRASFVNIQWLLQWWCRVAR